MLVIPHRTPFSGRARPTRRLGAGRLFVFAVAALAAALWALGGHAYAHNGDWHFDENEWDWAAPEDHAPEPRREDAPPAPEEPPERPKRPPILLLDDFRQLWPWSNESADDFARLTIVEENATVGDRALRVDFEAFGRGKFQVRRDAYLDLAGGESLLVDVYNAAGRMRLALGLETGRPPVYYESKTVDIEHGWNRDVAFPLNNPDFSLGDGSHRHRPANLDNTLKLSLVFFQDGNARGKVFIDNLRLAGEGAFAQNDGKPKFKAARTDRNSLKAFECVEIEVEVEGRVQDPFDRNEVDVRATFFSPSGKRREIQGFYDGARPVRSAPNPVWRVRFAPDEAGPWIYEIAVETPEANTSSGLRDFNVSENPDRRGYVRVSKSDPRYFELDNGDFFFPVGQNVAWATNMNHYLEAVSRYGGNVVRVWLCPWHLPIELKREPGRYDLGEARRLDAIIELAELHDVRVILVLYYHGITRDTWDQSPYNAVNGGPCRNGHEFFTHPEALALAKKKADYLISRIGHSTHLMAWELFNEANFADYRWFDDVVQWHRALGEHIRQADPYGRLITTSAGHWRWRDELYGLPVIDFIKPHIYSTDLGTEIDLVARRAEHLEKPVFLGEFAGHPHAVDVRPDRKGVHLHAGLWYTFTTPWAGTALPWWWDVQIEADNLYHHLRALARVAKGEDRRGHDFRSVTTAISTGQGRRADVRGILSPTLAYAWIYDAEHMKDPHADVPPVVRQESTMRLVGMDDGEFNVEVWDTWTGERLSRRRVASDDGRVEIVLPPSQVDLIVKVRAAE